MKPPSLSEIPENRVVASSNPPIRISNVWLQPDPTASPRVPMSCDQVRTFVAASSAVLACFLKFSICSPERPMAFI